MAAKKAAADEAATIPVRIQLQTDVTYWIQTAGGADFTRQFYVGNIITDPLIIAEIAERGFFFKEV